ncbi:MAG: DNA polymerase Y family protein [Rhizobiaceae bacterium]
MRRILSIWFPHFALERHWKAKRHAARFGGGGGEASGGDGGGDATKPFVLVEHGVRGTRITAINRAAQQAGAHVGQMLTDARAACPLIMVEQAQPEADDDMLQRLALWAGRYSPITSIDTTAAPDPVAEDFGLLLDISGCAHLFGAAAEEKLISDCLRRLAAMGFTAHAALAPTPGAAHALARYGSESFIITDTIEQAKAAAAALPVEALRLDQDRNTLLRRLGLKTAHSVIRVPRHALERRFRSKSDARSVQLRIDQFTGAIEEPLNPLRPAAPWRSHMPCPEPALDITGIRFALTELTARLVTRMETAAQGAQSWRLTAYHADGGSSAVAIRLSRASRDRSHVLRLFEDKLDRIDPGYGIDGFLLEAADCDAVEASQTSLVTGNAASAANEALAAELSGLVDRLSNRFGERNITYAAPVKSHVPERAWRMISASSSTSAAVDIAQWQEVEAETVFRTASRPFRLFDAPEAAEVTAQVPDGPPLNFRWRRVPRQITRARGPERIAPEWWRDGPRGVAIRDYYEVEDTEGRRYWLFREGLYGGKKSPVWFVHGVFGV